MLDFCLSFEIIVARLEHQHIWELSQRIATKKDLYGVGLKVLHIPEHEIQAALTNNQYRAQDAAHDVLRLWFKNQKQDDSSYIQLRDSLEENKFQQLADILRNMVEPTTNRRREDLF